jgi:hypothetical protein
MAPPTTLRHDALATAELPGHARTMLCHYSMDAAGLAQQRNPVE